MLSWCLVQRSKASARVRDRVTMLSWCPVQRSKASARVRDRVIMLSWCPVQRSKASTRVRDRVIMLSWCPVQRSKASTRVRDRVIITPRAHARARGYVIGRGVYYILYIYYILLYICKTFFYLSKYSLSEAHFSTGRLLIEFNGLWYSLALRGHRKSRKSVVWVKNRQRQKHTLLQTTPLR